MLTVPEAARRIGRNPETIRRWIREGRLAASKMGTQHLIDAGDLATATSRGGRRVQEAAAPYGSVEAPMVGAEAYPNQWLPAIVGRLVRAADPVRIVLFGTRAMAAGSTDADYELLVVLDEVADRPAARLNLRASFQDIDVSAAIFVVSAAEAAEGRRGTSRQALADGRVIYARDPIPPATVLQRLIDTGRVTPPANPDTSVLPRVWPAINGVSATETLLAERRADSR
jgi:excisionase family DNA binding protein